MSDKPAPQYKVALFYSIGSRPQRSPEEGVQDYSVMLPEHSMLGKRLGEAIAEVQPSHPRVYLVVPLLSAIYQVSFYGSVEAVEAAAIDFIEKAGPPESVKGNSVSLDAILDAFDLRKEVPSPVLGRYAVVTQGEHV
jgi:hypothetical protein